MPDQRAVNAASRAYWSAHEQLGIELRRAGFDPRKPETFPTEDEAPAALAAAMRAWDEANERLTVAQRATHGWRY